MDAYEPATVDAATALRLLIECPPHTGLGAYHVGLIQAMQASDVADQEAAALPLATRLRAWFLREPNPGLPPASRRRPGTEDVPWTLLASITGELPSLTRAQVADALAVVEEARHRNRGGGHEALRTLLSDGLALHELAERRVLRPADLTLCLALGRFTLDRAGSVRAACRDWGGKPAELEGLATRLDEAGERWAGLCWRLREAAGIVA